MEDTQPPISNHPRQLLRFMAFLQHPHYGTLIREADRFAEAYVERIQLEEPKVFDPETDGINASKARAEAAAKAKEREDRLQEVFGKAYLGVVLDFGIYSSHKEDESFFEHLISFLTVHAEKKMKDEKGLKKKEVINLQLAIHTLIRTPAFNRRNLNDHILTDPSMILQEHKPKLRGANCSMTGPRYAAVTLKRDKEVCQVRDLTKMKIGAGKDFRSQNTITGQSSGLLLPYQTKGDVEGEEVPEGEKEEGKEPHPASLGKRFKKVDPPPDAKKIAYKLAKAKESEQALLHGKDYKEMSERESAEVHVARESIRDLEDALHALHQKAEKAQLEAWEEGKPLPNTSYLSLLPGGEEQTRRVYRRGKMNIYQLTKLLEERSSGIKALLPGIIHNKQALEERQDAFRVKMAFDQANPREPRPPPAPLPPAHQIPITVVGDEAALWETQRLASKAHQNLNVLLNHSKIQSGFRFGGEPVAQSFRVKIPPKPDKNGRSYSDSSPHCVGMESPEPPVLPDTPLTSRCGSSRRPTPRITSGMTPRQGASRTPRLTGTPRTLLGGSCLPTPPGTPRLEPGGGRTTHDRHTVYEATLEGSQEVSTPGERSKIEPPRVPPREMNHRCTLSEVMASRVGIGGHPKKPKSGLEVLASSDSRSQMLRDIGRKDFDADTFDSIRLVEMVLLMFEELGCMNAEDRMSGCQIGTMALRKFLREVGSTSEDHPYHNWHTAVEKAQMLYHLLSSCGGKRFFDTHDIVAMLLVALCHNHKHPGQGLLYLRHHTVMKKAQAYFKKFYEELPSHILKLTEKKGCEIFGKYQAFDLAQVKTKMQQLSTVLYSSETRVLHDQPDPLLKLFHQHTNAMAGMLQEEDKESGKDYSEAWKDKDRHRLVFHFFFGCAMRLDLARPLSVSSRRFEALLKESPMIPTGGLHGGGVPGADFSLDSLQCESEAEAKSWRREVYQRLKYFIEETMEVPLISLARIMPKLDKVLEQEHMTEEDRSDNKSVLGAVVHFRRQLYQRIKLAKRCGVEEEEETNAEEPPRRAAAAAREAQKPKEVLASDEEIKAEREKGTAMLADINLRHRDVIKNWLTLGEEWEVPFGKPKPIKGSAEVSSSSSAKIENVTI